MSAASPTAVRKQIAQGTPDPVYLIVGDDEAEMAQLTSALSGLVEDELRACNVERIYATDKPASAVSIVEAASLLPMMSDRRVVVVLRAEKLLKPKRRGKADDEAEDDGAGASSGDADALEAYVKNPEKQTVLALVAADVDRTRRLYK